MMPRQRLWYIRLFHSTVHCLNRMWLLVLTRYCLYLISLTPIVFLCVELTGAPPLGESIVEVVELGCAQGCLGLASTFIVEVMVLRAGLEHRQVQLISFTINLKIVQLLL